MCSVRQQKLTTRWGVQVPVQYQSQLGYQTVSQPNMTLPSYQQTQPSYQQNYYPPQQYPGAGYAPSTQPYTGSSSGVPTNQYPGYTVMPGDDDNISA